MSYIAESRKCEGCTAGISPLARRDKRFCSASCRSRFAKRRRREERRASYSTPALSELERVLAAATEETRLVAQVARAAGTGNWRASAWLLERRYAERWGPPPRAASSVPAPLDDPDDPFAEVDELARRRERKPPGY